MKRVFRFCLLACIPLFSVACSGSKRPQNEFIIEGEVSDVDSSVVINLSKTEINNLYSYSRSLKRSNNDKIRKIAEEMYGRMSEEDKTTRTGYKITANLFPPPIAEVGDDMIDADLLDINGNIKNISDYFDSNKYLLLDFWYKACGHCLNAFPEMKEVLETYIENLIIICISFDTDDIWKKALSEFDNPWIKLRDPKFDGGLAANYGSIGAPYYVMISPEGKVVDKWFGYGKGHFKKKVSENIK